MKNGRGRIFLRGISSKGYGLRELRRRQHLAPRVLRTGIDATGATEPLNDIVRPLSWRGRVKQALGKLFATSHGVDQARAWGIIKPGDEPFLTQTLQVQFIELAPGGANHGHWHQNEAALYILEGRGYEVHDGHRYEWEKDDLVVVHNDCVHQHYNAAQDQKALILVLKAKSLWMYLGLLQQGHHTPVLEDGRYDPPEDWSRLWTPGVQTRKKVVKPSDAPWEISRDGVVRVLSSWQRTDIRIFSVDIYQHRIAVASRSAKHWHMADEVLYVLAGRGYSLQWDVEAEASERYQARVAKEPSRWDFVAGNLVYIPQNTVHQHFNADPTEPLLLLSAQNRIFKLLGYDSVVYLENAPEYRGPRKGVGVQEEAAREY